ncbi:XdhC family protein [Flavobacterium sp. W21_SRS_FM6]|uniref:XdhC family protein n=1 Tax=Flavobacterium sp. W21_SRS_FM6 TaxID=3240268 RepID=UPI003F8E741D
MANQLDKLLGHWLPQRDAQQWVLATIINTEGSSYRKAGAMMMINDLGQYFGMLSGGCLESDIMRQARRCWDNAQNRIVKYDMREEEDLAWQLGIGCGGMVEILLQPVSQANDYLHLHTLYGLLQNNQAGTYVQRIDQAKPYNQLSEALTQDALKNSGIQQIDNERYFSQTIRSAYFLAIFGAGVDARPVVAMAAALGWQVLLLDPRSGYAREGYFNDAQHIIRQPFEELSQARWLQQIDAALVLTHNIKLDAQALSLLQHSAASYVGLLGPLHRTERVLAHARLSKQHLHYPLANPVGLRLGGELPESIALSMLSEVHAFLEKTDAQSISRIVKP